MTSGRSHAGLLGFAQTLMPPPTARPAPPSADDSPPHPAKDAASARPPPAAAADSSLPPTAPEGTAAIAQLQRTSVQFLGIASFASPSSSTAAAAKRIQARVKAAQDRVRVAGGLGLVLGMCQIDERNPSTFSFSLPVRCPCLFAES